MATLLSAGVAWAGPYEDGLAAYKRGDYAEALKLLRPIASEGDAKAQQIVGSMFFEGKGVAVDKSEGLKWYRLAAAQGNADVQWQLGEMYETGMLPSGSDFGEAIKWYRLAAAQGYAPAQCDLGAVYEKGRGVPQDYGRAHMWFNLGVANGGSCTTSRDEVADKMSPQQIAEAQKMAGECKRSNYKDCD